MLLEEDEDQPICTSIRMMGKNPQKSFKFDRVLGPHLEQEQMFEIVGRPLVNQIMEGYNASIFAYG